MEHVARYIIAELTEMDFNPDFVPQPNVNYHVRKAARAILRYEDKIGLLWVANRNYHKLPGGGVEPGENLEEALKREILEETGCNSEVEDEYATTIEYRDQTNTLQISYVFSAKVVGEPGKPNYMDDELADGFELKWVPVKEVEEVMKNDKPSDYSGKFIDIRDKAVVAHFKDRLLK